MRCGLTDAVPSGDVASACGAGREEFSRGGEQAKRSVLAPVGWLIDVVQQARLGLLLLHGHRGAFVRASRAHGRRPSSAAGAWPVLNLLNPRPQARQPSARAPFGWVASFETPTVNLCFMARWCTASQEVGFGAIRVGMLTGAAWTDKAIEQHQ